MAVRKQVFDDDDDNAENPKKRSRIAFDVNPALRRRIKMAAARNDLSIGEYLGPILEQFVPDEPATPSQRGYSISDEAFDQLMRFREELKCETNGHVFDNSSEILRQEREKRTRYLMGEDVDE